MTSASSTVTRETVEDLLYAESALLDGHQYSAWLELFDDAQCLHAVAGLAQDLDSAELLQQVEQLIPRQLLVVHHDDAQVPCRAHAVIRAGTLSSGMTIRAQVPWPGTLSSCSW